jgi:large subunit ribosomal protein L22
MSPDRIDAPEGGWESLKVDELKEQLEARGLPKSGKKDELIARLEEHDESPPEAPEAGATEEVVAPEEPAEEPVAEEVGEADAKPARRRGSAETSTATPSAPRRPDGDVVVRARSRYVRTAPRKARLVMDNIRGKEVDQARAILNHAPRAVAADILKLLNSAIANAESAYELGADELRIDRAFVDEGPTIKRYRPRALGRATPIKKRTSHMTIELTTTANGR